MSARGEELKRFEDEQAPLQVDENEHPDTDSDSVSQSSESDPGEGPSTDQTATAAAPDITKAERYLTSMSKTYAAKLLEGLRKFHKSTSASEIQMFKEAFLEHGFNVVHQTCEVLLKGDKGKKLSFAKAYGGKNADFKQMVERAHRNHNEFTFKEQIHNVQKVADAALYQSNTITIRRNIRGVLEEDKAFIKGEEQARVNLEKSLRDDINALRNELNKYKLEQKDEAETKYDEIEQLISKFKTSTTWPIADSVDIQALCEQEGNLSETDLAVIKAEVARCCGPHMNALLQSTEEFFDVDEIRAIRKWVLNVLGPIQHEAEDGVAKRVAQDSNAGALMQLLNSLDEISLDPGFLTAKKAYHIAKLGLELSQDLLGVESSCYKKLLALRTVFEKKHEKLTNGDVWEACCQTVARDRVGEESDTSARRTVMSEYQDGWSSEFRKWLEGRPKHQKSNYVDFEHNGSRRLNKQLALFEPTNSAGTAMVASTKSAKRSRSRSRSHSPNRPNSRGYQRPSSRDGTDRGFKGGNFGMKRFRFNRR